MLTERPDPLVTKDYPLGAVIIQAGADSPKEMVVVIKGNVGIYKNYKLPSEMFIKTISAGSFQGERSLFLKQEQTESAVALTPVTVMTVNRRNVKEFFTAQTDMAISVVENICKRLSDVTEELEKLEHENITSARSKVTKLFPEGHGSYLLELSNTNEQLVYCTKVTCPLCGNTFDSLGVMMSRLRRSTTDPDMRIRYKDVEPLYYDIVTCPNCLFSADNHSFPDVSKDFADKVNQKLGPLKLETPIQEGRGRDTFSVFAGYYLALITAKEVFADYQLNHANLWLKLSRIYNDVGDTNMEDIAAKNALENYKYAYSNFRLGDKANYQVCYIIADLTARFGDNEAAKNYFFSIKRSPGASEVLKRQSDLRIDQIREIEKKLAEAENPTPPPPTKSRLRFR